MLNIIVAHCRNRGIGIKNSLPWKLKSDMKMFKKLTIGDGNNSVIMGRKTWESLPNKYLPDRKNIVISNSIKYINDDIPVFNNIHAAYNYVVKNEFNTNWIIGGSEIYKDSLKNLDIDEIFVTNIDKKYDCDVFFPNVDDYNYFKIESSEEYIEDDIKFRNEIYVKNRAHAQEVSCLEETYMQAYMM